MRRVLRWIIGAPIFLAVMFFAVANRRWVTLSLDPINETSPSLAIDMPLWLLLFLGIFIGIIVGWFFCWLAQGKWRKLARERQVQINKLKNEMLRNRDSASEGDAKMLTPLPGFMP